MNLSTVDIDAPQTDAEPDVQPATEDVQQPAEQPVADTAKRRLAVPARRRVAHRLVSRVIAQALDGGGFDHGVEGLTDEDATAVRALIREMADDHERRSF